MQIRKVLLACLLVLVIRDVGAWESQIRKDEELLEALSEEEIVNLKSHQGCRAQFLYSIATRKGYKVERNLDESFAYLMSSAKCGYPLGQMIVGFFFQEGIILIRDRDLAVKWYGRAISKNQPEAMFLLANLLLNDPVVSTDASRAVELLRASAGLDYPFACDQLGRLYLFGELVEKDMPTAVHYLEKAGKIGYGDSYKLLYIIFREGLNVEANSEMAVRYYGLWKGAERRKLLMEIDRYLDP